MPSVLVRLRPSGPWRIGPDSGDRDRVDRIYHSDALYSAVSGAMARLGDLAEWLDATARQEIPAVRLSSCFPFHGESLYVVPPRHVWPPAASSKVRWKGARFVPLKVVEAVLSRQPLSEDAWVVDGESECLLPSSAAGAALFKSSVRSYAAIDRAGEAVATHSSGCLEFTPGSGLWFLATFASDAALDQWNARVRAAVRLLADSGFGGGRSRGWGRSEAPEFTENPSLLPEAAEGVETGHWMLSLFHPAAGDGVDWRRGDYSMITRGGRVESEAGSGGEKKNTRMIAEGSVLVSGAEPTGSAADVAPDGFEHPVYRAGFAVSLRVPLTPPVGPAV